MVRTDERSIGIPVSVITDCDVRPDYNNENVFIEKRSESAQQEIKNNEKYTRGSVRGFTSPVWTLEYCIAMSCLSEDFHKSVHYGKKIFNAKEYIALTDNKIDEANQETKKEEEQWQEVSSAEKAYKIYDLMLNNNGKSGLKAIVAQCFASLLRWKISVIPDELKQEKMFDLDLYRLKIDIQKKSELKSKIERDQFLNYIVKAIKYAAGESV